MDRYELGKNFNIGNIAVIIGPCDSSYSKFEKNKLKGKSIKITSVSNGASYPYRAILEGEDQKHHLAWNDKELRKKIVAVDTDGNLY